MGDVVQICPLFRTKYAIKNDRINYSRLKFILNFPWKFAWNLFRFQTKRIRLWHSFDIGQNWGLTETRLFLDPLFWMPDRNIERHLHLLLACYYDSFNSFTVSYHNKDTKLLPLLKAFDSVNPISGSETDCNVDI